MVEFYLLTFYRFPLLPEARIKDPICQESNYLTTPPALVIILKLYAR